jgi:hypothetical protein
VGTANVVLNLNLQLKNNKQGALCIPKLLKVESGVLEGKYIVAQLIICAACMMYLSDKSRSDMSSELLCCLHLA